MRSRILLLALIAAFPAAAYKRSVVRGTNLCTWWPTRGHSFQIDQQGTPDVPGLAAFTAIRASFQTWEQIPCSELSFEDLGVSSDPKDRVVGYFSGQANRNLVLFRTQSCRLIVPSRDSCLTQGGCANLYDCWDHAEKAIGTTTTTALRTTGEIIDSDIELNDAPHTDGSRFVFTANDGGPCASPTQTGCVRIDVQNTVTHEAGHTIGLDHTPDPAATMYASAMSGETSKRALGADDIQAVCDIYPKGKRTLTCGGDPSALALTAADAGGCGCSQTQTGPGAALVSLVLLLRMTRRSRSRPGPR